MQIDLSKWLTQLSIVPIKSTTLLKLLCADSFICNIFLVALSPTEHENMFRLHSARASEKGEERTE